MKSTARVGLLFTVSLFATGLPARAQTRLFPGEQFLLPVGGYAPRLVDLNSDAILDLLTMGVTVQLGDGEGHFGSSTTYPLLAPGLRTGALVTDLNGDAFVDVVHTVDGPQSGGFVGRVNVMLGNGQGGFGASTAHVVGYYPLSPCAADFDSDGIVDIAVVQDFYLGVSVLKGIGGGAFGTTVSTTVTGYAAAIDVVDANADGKSDLVALDSATHLVYFLLGNGAAGFTQSAPLPLSFVPNSVSARDLNADGRLDLVFLSNAGLVIRLALPAGGFGPESLLATTRVCLSFTVGDTDVDGDVDIVAASADDESVYLFLGDGQGGFSAAHTHRVGGLINNSTIGDVDSDGFPDILVTTGGSSVMLLFGDGQGAFVAPGTHKHVLGSNTTPNFSVAAAGDFDGDGTADFAGSVDLATLVINKGTSTGVAPTPLSTLSFVDRVYTVVTGDMNADGKLDIVTLNQMPSPPYTCTAIVSLNSGTGTFSSGPAYVMAPSSTDFVLHDFDSDGDLDVVMSNRDASGISMRFNDGVGGLGPLVTPSIPIFTGTQEVRPTSLAVGDVDADGLPDLVTCSGIALIIYLRNAGGGTFAQQTYLYPHGNVTSVRLADIDADGALDVVAALYSPSALDIFTHTSTGSFAPARAVRVAGRPGVPVIGDVDADGLLDVMVSTVLTQGMTVLPGAGAGNFEAARYFALGNRSGTPMLADLDHDGLLDVACHNTSYESPYESSFVFLRNERDEPLRPLLYCSGGGPNSMCPCANGGGVGRGCGHSQSAIGARLDASGEARVSADTLVLTSSALPVNCPGLFVQGSNRALAPYGDGLVCVGGGLVRIGVVFTIGSAAQYPPSVIGAVPLSVAGSVTAGSSVNFQHFYRDSAAFCTPSTFNSTNGVAIVWAP